MHTVILSGGSGTRLWPLSREAYPKQFLSLISEESLLAETIQRACDMPGCQSVLAITNEDHRFIVAAHLQKQCGDISRDVVLEPVGRNTAPAIALAALSVSEDDPQGVMVVMPSDHVLKNQGAFAQAMDVAVNVARAGSLVTFGVVPKIAHTGYGYIKAGKNLGIYSGVAEFVEKPDLETAERYLEAGNYYWNSGMFVFRADRYLEELEEFSPEIVKACRLAYDKRKRDMDFTRVDEEAFASCPEDSIDYAVMEKTDAAVVVPLDAGWSDVGSWSALWEIQEHDGHGNVCRGDVIVEDVENSYIHSEGRLIAAIGVKEHVIVETDDVVLVAAKDRVQEVKKLVAQVKAQDRQEHRFHKRVHRPWGTYEGVAKSHRFQVKRITVKPGAKLSLQKHHHRAEHWVIVSGTALINRGEEEILLTEDQSTYIPLGVVHRLSNPGVIPLEVIEVQTGSYLGEDDIVRYEDTYNRC